MTIDPDFLDELRRYDATIDRTSDATRRGDQDSPSLGEGLTFSDYRRYSPGDDTRLIDWRLYGRTEEYFIKQFEEERSLTVHVLLDASGSMDYGDGPRHKFEYAAKIGLGFAFLAAEEHNDFRISTVRDRHERLDTGRSNHGDLLRAIDLLNGTTPAGEGDIAAALTEYAATIDSRSLVVVASDFLADPDAVERGLAALARGGNDLVCPQVLAPDERDPEAAGDTIFRDLETEREHRTYFGGTVESAYRERLDRHVEAVADRCRRLRATHALVDTGDDFFDSFGRVWVG